MKSRKWIFIVAVLGLTYYLFTMPTSMVIPADLEQKFKAFKMKEKFIEEPTSYPGAQTPEKRAIMVDKINRAADDFIRVAKREKPTEKDFQQTVGIGLARFKEIYTKLDTEDRERICMYFEEMMGIIGLESSNGQLNNFMYGFDPADK